MSIFCDKLTNSYLCCSKKQYINVDNMCKKLIYKYYPCNTFSIESLMFGYLWFSKPSHLNDPFDCNLSYVLNLPFCQAYTEDRQKIVETFDSFGVCCFSHDEVGEHFWSLYANNYSGFRVAFDYNKLQKYLIRMGIIYESIDYQDTPIDIEKEMGNDPSDYIHRLDQVLRRCIFRKKANPWKVENEERFFMGLVPINNIEDGKCLAIKEEKGYKVPFPLDCIKEIVVGHNIKDALLRQIKSIRRFRYPDVSMYQLEVNSKDWKLNKKEI